VDECKPLATGCGTDKFDKDDALATEFVTATALLRSGNYGRGLHSSTFQLNLSRVDHTSPCPSI